MAFRDLQQFVRHLESKKQLKRIQTEVDPVLEVPEISQRVLREGGPALLFEHPKGAAVPLLMNLFGTADRIREALGRQPAEIGSEILRFAQNVNPLNFGKLWGSRPMIKRVLAMRPTSTSRAIVQRVQEKPNLLKFPVLQCWPGDAGRFITYGMVLTQHPTTARRNLGLYRLQIFDSSHTGMHWQSMKGGRGHYWEAEKMGNALPVAVVIGADPILMMSSILPLPEDIDEIAFAGFLRGSRVPMAQGKTVNLMVPANAEIILEGRVPVGERRMEGPFGDHFGHYSEAAEFPVFHVTNVTHRKDPIYVATVVGKPPQEDKYLGIAAGELIGPLIKLIHPNIVDMCAYAGAGFHNLLVVSVKERHPKEVLKTAMAILGTGQLALTKVLVLVGPDRNPRDFKKVLKDLWHRFEPEDHMLLLPFAPLDTLDFTSYKMHVGSKLVLDATDEIREQKDPPETIDPGRFDPRIANYRLLDGGFLVVVPRENPRDVVQKLVQAPLGVRFVVAVSPDVALDDEEQLQWGIFTRFDPARDMFFGEQGFVGARPVYRGIVGIDATWKEGYPAPLEMDPEVALKVDRRWATYWK